MRQHFDICGDYQADNPFLERQPFKHLFMKYAFLAYKKARISISKFQPLKDWQEYLWREDELLNLRQFDNSAIKCIEDEPPFLQIKHISILELIPKEDWNVVVKGIDISVSNTQPEKHLILIPLIQIGSIALMMAMRTAYLTQYS